MKKQKIISRNTTKVYTVEAEKASTVYNNIIEELEQIAENESNFKWYQDDCLFIEKDFDYSFFPTSMGAFSLSINKNKPDEEITVIPLEISALENNLYVYDYEMYLTVNEIDYENVKNIKSEQISEDIKEKIKLMKNKIEDIFQRHTKD